MAHAKVSRYVDPERARDFVRCFTHRLWRDRVSVSHASLRKTPLEIRIIVFFIAGLKQRCRGSETFGCDNGATAYMFSFPPADGVGTNEIMPRTPKSKTCVWRRQEGFIVVGFDGLRDKTRPSRIKPLDAETAARVVA